MFSTPFSTTISGVAWAIFGALSSAIIGLSVYSWSLRLETSHLRSVLSSTQSDRDEYKRASEACDASTKKYKADAEKAQSELNARMVVANANATYLEKRAEQYVKLVRTTRSPDSNSVTAPVPTAQTCDQAEDVLDQYLSEARP